MLVALPLVSRSDLPSRPEPQLGDGPNRNKPSLDADQGKKQQTSPEARLREVKKGKTHEKERNKNGEK